MVAATPRASARSLAVYPTDRRAACHAAIKLAPPATKSGTLWNAMAGAGLQWPVLADATALIRSWRAAQDRSAFRAGRIVYRSAGRNCQQLHVAGVSSPVHPDVAPRAIPFSGQPMCR